MNGIKSRKYAPQRGGERPVRISVLLASIAMSVPPLTAGAQSPPTTNVSGEPIQLSTTELSKIEVIGTAGQYEIDAVQSPKFTQPLLDTPQTVNVISGEVIREQGAATLTEALRNSPGVGTFYVGENGKTSTGDAVYMRGFDASGSIFVDGVRDSGSIARDTFDTEQVQVIKGPDGTVFGRTTPTGAINMVSKQARLSNGVSATVSYGTSNQRRSTVDWSHVIGHHAAFRLNVMGQKSGVPGRDDVRNDRWGVAPSLAFGIDTPTRVYLNFLHVTQNNVPDGFVPTVGLPGFSTPDPARPFLSAAPKVDPSNFYGTDADHDHVKADMATLIVQHDFSDNVALHDTLRWGRTYQNYLVTSWRSTDKNVLTPDPADASTWTVARSDPNFKDQVNRILTNQANLTAHFATGTVEHDLSAGIELTREEIRTVGIGALNNSAWPAFSLYAPDPHVTGLIVGATGTWARGRTDTAGIYAFDTLHFGERWLLTAGARLDHYDTHFRSMMGCGGENALPCGGSKERTPVPGVNIDERGNLSSYKLGLVYKPAANGSVYANFATASTPPGGNSLEFTPAPGYADNPIFNPQKARTVEVGAKWNVFGDQLQLTAALYRTVVSNLIVQDSVDMQFHQIGRERVKGVELGAVGQVTRHWALSAGYTVINTTASSGIVSSSSTSSSPATDGSGTLGYTPKSAFTAWSTWNLPQHVTLGVGARYSGEMQRGADRARPDHDSAVGTPEYTEAYWVFDAMASYAITFHVSLRLNAYNLFDKYYVAAINKSGFRYSPGMPRSALLTLNIDF